MPVQILQQTLVAKKQLSLINRAVRILLDGTQGWWYDPSDFSTLFQDAAGTTPVTAVEQPVGLMLDKSFGLVLGPELVTNGDFSNGITGWTPTNVTTSTASGALLMTVTTATSPGVQQTLTTVVGKTYLVTCDATAGAANVTANSARLAIAAVGVAAVSGNGVASKLRYVFTATVTNHTIQFQVASSGAFGAIGDTATFDNISVRELPGNHATQATSTSRPILRNRYNLLTKTEQFDDAVWSVVGSTRTYNAGVAPSGTSNACLLIESAGLTRHMLATTSQITVPSNTNVTFSRYVKAKERRYCQLAVLNTGSDSASVIADVETGQITATRNTGNTTLVSSSCSAPDSNGWCLVSITAKTTATAFFCNIGLSNSSTFAGAAFEFDMLKYTGDGTSGIYIWGADLRPAADANLPYQRVNTATDYDSAPSKFPLYLDPDGSDDGMATAAFAAGSDKVTAFAAVHKRSDAAIGMIYEFSGNVNANLGSFYLIGGASVAAAAAYGVSSRGTSVPADANTAYTYAAPRSDVLTLKANIAGDTISLRVRGVQAAQSVADQGTGNYGTYPLYLFRRGGTSLPFNGRFYGGAGKFRTLSDSEIATVEQYLRMKSRAY